ncbi:hypothetical protein WDL1P1_00533 (plasmid) [Variovorax sp. WDL1]|nr:hypothetical protein CHC06_06099 [Variovorax sp. B2]PNG51348.1 hypothetical protein CHC07_06005 [Variovorax sp. B4]VTU43167.1 hypothetical protein H6P1_00375 [Variovorax sp. PBL-H6]VTU43398.1 hypothetical protein SRS16P1_00530 [Variovorax sp. SRS16]VTU43462.1 hypothetical protein E5P1_00526 [Variovorax sp. PBL-E5]VTV17618.1 hypothetical protein WDL1P1_00533 [Variovorax sp. WDL1]
MSPHPRLRSLAATVLLGAALIAQAAEPANGVNAEAAGLMSQANHLTRASVLYALKEGRWPYALTHLSPSFLTAVPSPPRAFGRQAEWRTVRPGFPAAWVRTGAPIDLCRALNLQARGDDGIYKAAQPAMPLQCYGRSAPFTVLVLFAEGETAALHKALRRAGGWKHGAADRPHGSWSVPPNVRSPSYSPEHH